MKLEFIFNSVFALYSNYLITLMLLFPVIVCYLFLLINRPSSPHILTTHKMIVVVLCALPILLGAWELASQGNNAVTISETEDLVPTQGFLSESNTVLTVERRYSANANVPFTDMAVFLAGFSSVAITLFSALFLIGLCTFVAKLIRQKQYLKFLDSTADSIQQYEDLTIVKSEKVDSAFSTYLFEKVIYLPKHLTSEQTEVILQHEINHFRCRHHSWQLLESLMVHLYWFNPFSYLLRRAGENYRELECDDLTIQTIDKFKYGTVLIETAEQLRANQTSTLLCHSWTNKAILQKRVENLMGQKHTVKFRRFKLCSLALFTSALTGCWYADLSNTANLEEDVLQHLKTTTATQREQNTYVDLDKVPLHFIDFLLQAEDKRFYSHSGVDNLAMTRATTKFFRNIIFNSDKRSGGASTITMQLAKTIQYELPTGWDKGSIPHKAQQMRIAKLIESHYSKDEILAMYLSSVFMGHKNYGIKQAAEYYFQIPYTELTLEQSAMFIQLLAGPSLFNPKTNPERASHRAKTLLAGHIANLNKKH